MSKATAAGLWLAVAMLAGASDGRAEPLTTEIALAAGDTLRFDILDDDLDPVELLVAADGAIQAPFVGAVQVAGLPVRDALEALKESYREQQIFVSPKLSLSVAAFRPIYVVGDVRQPGSYPYNAQLTVQKAVGLAGGHVTAAATDDPIMARARLRGDLDGIHADILREALATARITAQLAERLEIEDEDIPLEARLHVRGASAEAVRGVELQILESEANGFEDRKAILEQGVTEAESQIDLLERLSETVSKSVELTRADLERARELQQRGITTLSEVSDLERQMSLEEGRQLQVLATLSEARRGLGTLRSQLADLVLNRRMTALTELQLHSANLEKALASARAAEEQLILLSAMEAEDAEKNRQVVLDYSIRRGPAGETTEISAIETTLVAPGDVVEVRIRTSDDPSAVAALPAGSPAPDVDAWR